MWAMLLENQVLRSSATSTGTGKGTACKRPSGDGLLVFHRWRRGSSKVRSVRLVLLSIPSESTDGPQLGSAVPARTQLSGSRTGWRCSLPLSAAAEAADRRL